MSGTLIRAGKPYDLLVFPEATHTSLFGDCWDRAVGDYLAEHLGAGADGVDQCTAQRGGCPCPAPAAAWPRAATGCNIGIRLDDWHVFTRPVPQRGSERAEVMVACPHTPVVHPEDAPSPKGQESE